MTGYVLKRSIPSIGGLVALLVGVAFLAVAYAGAPLWFPALFTIGLIGLQYVINPAIIEWLVPARIIGHNGTTYATDYPVGRIVAERCRQAKIPLVKLGIVDDGTPNAFTFGHHRGDARIWLTRGLIERLDERELDAVVAHEIGHVRNLDFVVMTVAAVVPMALYLLFVVTRRQRGQAAAVAAVAYVGYLVSQFVLLSLSRAREYGADHWSCASTGDGDALVSALIKVAYGIGQADAERQVQVAALVAQGAEGKKAAHQVKAKAARVQSMRAMGIFEPRHAEAISVAFANGGDAERALSALRWDVVNPWGKTLEKLSSHPLVARRIKALAESGLPGAPRTVDVSTLLADADPATAATLRGRYLVELFAAVAPWAILIPMVGFGALTHSTGSIGLGLVAAGVLLVVKQSMRYPGRHQPAGVADLLHRLDASPVRGIAVELTGRVIGRGFPGYVLSPDLVVQDQTGFVPLQYQSPIPFARAWFGARHVRGYLGHDVVARGWYRRSPGPVVELRDFRSAGLRSVSTWMWKARIAFSVGLAIIGIIVTAAGAGH